MLLKPSTSFHRHPPTAWTAFPTALWPWFSAPVAYVAAPAESVGRIRPSRPWCAAASVAAPHRVAAAHLEHLAMGQTKLWKMQVLRTNTRFLPRASTVKQQTHA